jgi:hypothetical protein
LKRKHFFRLSRVLLPPLTKNCCGDFSVALRDRGLKFLKHLWFKLKLCMPFLEFWNFLSKILKSDIRPIPDVEVYFWMCQKVSYSKFWNFLKKIVKKLGIAIYSIWCTILCVLEVSTWQKENTDAKSLWSWPFPFGISRQICFFSEVGLSDQCANPLLRKGKIPSITRELNPAPLG